VQAPAAVPFSVLDIDPAHADTTNAKATETIKVLWLMSNLPSSR